MSGSLERSPSRPGGASSAWFAELEVVDRKTRVAEEGKGMAPNVIRAGELHRSERGTIAFEGEGFGSQVSVYLIQYRDVGDGPGLHKHPYPETWILRDGRARFTVGEDIVEASSGDILVGPAEVPHMFENLGSGVLDIMCIHPSPRFIQEDLDSG